MYWIIRHAYLNVLQGDFKINMGIAINVIQVVNNVMGLLIINVLNAIKTMNQNISQIQTPPLQYLTLDLDIYTKGYAFLIVQTLHIMIELLYNVNLALSTVHLVRLQLPAFNASNLLYYIMMDVFNIAHLPPFIILLLPLVNKQLAKIQQV